MRALLAEILIVINSLSDKHQTFQIFKLAVLSTAKTCYTVKWQCLKTLEIYDLLIVLDFIQREIKSVYVLIIYAWKVYFTPAKAHVDISWTGKIIEELLIQFKAVRVDVDMLDIRALRHQHYCIFDLLIARIFRYGNSVNTSELVGIVLHFRKLFESNVRVIDPLSPDLYSI